MARFVSSFKKWARLVLTTKPAHRGQIEGFWMWLSPSARQRQPWLFVTATKAHGREIAWVQYDIAGEKVWGLKWK